MTKLLLALLVLGCDPSTGGEGAPPESDAGAVDDAGALDDAGPAPATGGGEVAWEFAIGGWGASPAVGADGTIFLARVVGKDYGGGSVTAVDAEGRTRWTYALPAHEPARVCGDPPATGDVSEWEAGCDEWTGGGAWTIEAGRTSLYVGQASYSPVDRDAERFVLALSQADGRELWRHPIGYRDVATHIALDADENLYFATHGRGETAFHAVSRDGVEVWTHVLAEEEDSFPGSAAITGDTVVFGGDRLRAFRDGALVWERDISTSAGLYGPAVDADGDLWVLSPVDLRLHELGPDGGALGEVVVGFTETTPVLGRDGTVHLHNYPAELFPRGDDPGAGLPAGVHALAPDLSVRWSATEVMRSDDPDWAPSRGVTGSDSIPALAPDGTLYLGSEHGSVYAIRDGAVLWERRLFSEFDMRLAIAGDLVVACQNGFIRFESDSARCYALRR